MRVLGGSDDVDNLTTPGTYSFITTAGEYPAHIPDPNGQFAGNLKVEYSYAGDRPSQTLTFLSNPERVYMRRKGSTGWHAWSEISNTQISKRFVQAYTLPANGTYTSDPYISFYLIVVGYSSGTNGGFIIYWSNHSGSLPALMGGTMDSNIVFSRDANGNHVMKSNLSYAVTVYSVIG